MSRALQKLPPEARLLCELIALPSVNPAFLPPGDARAGEARAGDFVASVAGSAGLAVEAREVFPGRRNILAHYTPAGRIRQRVVLAPHLDTVGSADGDDSIFEPRAQGGRVWGRGACDTKGSVAAFLTALMQMVEGTTRPQHTEVIFVGLVDEEHGQAGSRALVKSRFRADLGIVGEPTCLSVITAHKGDVWARLATRGKAAHGACPDRGVNAVRLMARAVELLEDEYAAWIARRRHPLLGRPTVNVGLIRGGTQPNIVPDRCVIEVDRRTVPGETEAAVKREMVAFLRKRGIAVSLEDVKGVPAPPLETDPGLPLVRAFMDNAGQRDARGVDYFTDAAVLASGGTPCVVFGPGDIAQAHTAREWISIRSLERGTALLRRFLERLP
ncbi:MAG: M20/M25/M40 family metallo-hydrolase [Verrucomicrobiales bacterium]|nr:M20/M25/M40 family metallo-hydrolase [Verrucomicrobiales bacterium]